MDMLCIRYGYIPCVGHCKDRDLSSRYVYKRGVGGNNIKICARSTAIIVLFYVDPHVC